MPLDPEQEALKNMDWKDLPEPPEVPPDTPRIIDDTDPEYQKIRSEDAKLEAGGQAESDGEVVNMLREIRDLLDSLPDKMAGAFGVGV